MFKHYIHKALTLPPHVTVRKAAGKIKRMASETCLRRKDCKVSSYAAEYPNGKFFSCFPKLVPEHLLPHAETIPGLTKHYLDHRFDLLGSGWVQVKHGMYCRGLEGYRYDMGSSIQADPEGKWLEGRINSANLEESKRIWKLIFCNQLKTQNSKPKTYSPIDWYLDFKSGYRWSESTWHKDIRYGHKLGVDVKVPWELARMQHLPQLAYAYALAAQSSPEKWPSDFTGQAKPKVQSQEHGQETEFENQKSKTNQLESPERYAQEFRSQILAFIATNPPRFGVNWACTMDVGIRVANWLAAYDLFCACGAEFDREFLEVFKRSVYEHGLHIINNLEWNEEHRSNHYLSDIAGLLFVTAYLPQTPEIDAWLAFAVQELINEVENQFHPDGGNFEASTSYHRLSAEMVIYATALVLGLPEEKSRALKSYDCKLIRVKPALKPAPLSFYQLPIKGKFNDFTICESPFPEWYFECLEKMAEFTMHITKPNNHIPQIGDNDSGRFVKIQPIFRKTTVACAKEKYANLKGYNHLPDQSDYIEEDFLDHRSLVAAINGLFNRKEFAQFTGNSFIETELIQKIIGGIRLSSCQRNGAKPSAKHVRIGSGKIMHDLIIQSERVNSLQKQVASFKITDEHFFDTLELISYPNFGIYIYRNDQFYLLIRCGPVGQNGFGGHAHNDQLSIELQIDLKDIAVDPGTYLYTPLSDLRNQYRSVSAHYGPQLAESREPGRLDLSLFQLPEQANCECLYFQKDGFAGVHHGYGDPVYRLVSFKGRDITIIDFTTGHLILKPIDLFNNLIDSEARKVPISPGYGLQYNLL